MTKALTNLAIGIAISASIFLADSKIAKSSELEALAQVTSVSQLSDVQPTDWAFQALQSLVERYGCIAGYPDSTYRGERALTRYEFAAGLNACLDRVNELVATSTANLVSKEDLSTLQRLQAEFATELTALRGRVDALEVQAAELEANQFSTTTKLVGELITYTGDAFGENADAANNATIGYRARLDFNTSFTGQDRLRARLQMTNLRLFDTGATFGGSPNVALGGVSNETRFTPSSVTQNGEVRLSQLEYRFPIGDRLRIYLEANTIDASYVTDTIIPFIDTATGALSNFSQVNPIYFPLGNQAGIAASYNFTPAISFDFGYFGEDSSTGAPNNPGEDSGLFNGGYSAFGQLVYAGDRAKLGLLYINSYSPRNGVDTLAGSNAAKVIGAGPVVGNGYGAQANYRITDGFELGGWVGYTAARSLGVRGDASIFNYAVTLSFPDLGREGNLGGIVVGMQPRLTETSSDALASAIGLPLENGVQSRSDRNSGMHIEAFYRYQVNDNISITPGFFWLTAPNHDSRNPDVVIGVIRTSFIF
ncbi:iron uptake porin [Aliterella atlantica]|uniref:iron uptake porin n=1 Tax=Aliterella atlantica TaxID=1827278 RepID=UPI0005D2E7C3|nr:iron uptake porin [Aliterella atlantica]